MLSFLTSILNNKVFRHYAKAPILVICTLIACYLTPLGTSIKNLALSIDFKIRASTSHRPTIDKRLKIISFDDSTAKAMNYNDLTLAKWNYLIYGLSVHNPSAIYLVMPFQSTLQNSYKSRFVERMKNFKFPIYVSGLVDQPLYPSDPDQNDTINLKNHTINPTTITWIENQPVSLYANPPSDIAKAFTKSGHTELDSFGKIKPLIRLANEKVVPHIAFLNEKIKIGEKGIKLKSKLIHPDRSGSIQVNLIAKSELSSITHSLEQAYSKIKEKEKIPFLSKGDVIVILPHSSALEEHIAAPLGYTSANSIHVSMINSTLTNEWLEPFFGNILLIIASCLMGTLLSVYCRRNWIIPAGGLAAISIFFGSLATFIYLGKPIAWPFPIFGLISCTYLNAIKRSYALDQQSNLVRHGLQGRMSPQRINALLSNNDKNLIATEATLTIMFIDIVGFSRTSIRHTPEESFRHLNQLMDTIKTTIHEYGGDVDRTMGDALLCVFGYQINNGFENTGHADQALKCAEAIQRNNVFSITHNKNGPNVFPLRIGINTATVHIGNLGNHNKIELTVIGPGVNFAHRLQLACDHHKVMLGATTVDFLKHVSGEEETLVKRLIRFKHEEDLHQAYEFNPFANEVPKLIQAEEAYRMFLGKDRKTKRRPIDQKAMIKIQTLIGNGLLVDISLNGVSAELPEYLSVGMSIALSFATENEKYRGDLDKLGQIPITAEVRWGVHSDGRYLHGLEFKNLSQNQKDLILSILEPLTLAEQSNQQAS